MVCDFCNHEIDDHAEVCPYCGTQYQALDQKSEEERNEKTSQEAFEEQVAKEAELHAQKEAEEQARLQKEEQERAQKESEERAKAARAAHEAALERLEEEREATLSGEAVPTKDGEPTIMLHDELDRIGQIRARSHKRRNRILAVLLVSALCILGAWLGMRYFNKHYGATQPVANDTVKTETGVPGSVTKKLFGKDFTKVKVLDEATAKDALNSVKSTFSITDERVDFDLTSKVTVGDVTYYRFAQTVANLPVVGGEMVLAASENGTPLGLNGSVVGTDGLSLDAVLDVGAAGNAVAAYVNKLSGEHRVTSGTSVTEAKKTVCNFEGKTYLSYLVSVSGYNEGGEYVAFDAFVDAVNGNGITLRHKASYEQETAQELEQEAIHLPITRTVSSDSLVKLYMVNDKFNWNDKSKTGALSEIPLADIPVSSSYVQGVKKSVDKAYTYFKDMFSYKGLDGKNGAYSVYLNANEYVKDKLPPERALASNNMLMLISSDSATETPNDNVVVHEYAHGVMQNLFSADGTRALTENAVICEGVADIFGELSEIHFNGKADWVHGTRNIGTPENGYVTVYTEGKTAQTMADCYRQSTILSHAAYKMCVNGTDVDAVGEILFKTLCMMTYHDGFSEFRSLAELTAKNMVDAGRLSVEQFNVVVKALADTNISAVRLYAAAAEALPGDVSEQEQPTIGVEELEDPVSGEVFSEDKTAAELPEVKEAVGGENAGEV